MRLVVAVLSALNCVVKSTWMSSEESKEATVTKIGIGVRRERVRVPPHFNNFENEKMSEL